MKKDFLNAHTVPIPLLGKSPSLIILDNILGKNLNASTAQKIISVKKD